MADVTIEQLQKIVENQGETIEAQGKLIDALKKQVNAKSTIELNKAEKLPEIPKEPIEYKGEKYVWKAAIFRVPGVDGPIKAKEASLDEAIIEKLLSIKNQGILVKQQ